MVTTLGLIDETKDRGAEIARAARPAALAFIFVTVLVDVLAFGLVIPVLPRLVEKLAGGGTRDAAQWVGIFGTTFAVIQLVSSPFQGALSDRFGRRPIILASCLGLGLDFALMAIAPTIGWLLVGRVVSAITSASFSTANAYVADVTPPEGRAKSFGMLGAAFGLGFILGPMLGGFLGGKDLRYPFFAAGALATANFAYGLFVLPESLPPEKRAKSLGARGLNPLAPLALFRTSPQLLGLAVVILLYNLAHHVYPSVFVLFADAKFSWGPREVGGVLAVVGVFSVIVQVGLVGRIVAKLGERKTVLVGSLFGALGFAIFGLAPTGLGFLAGIPVMSLWGIASPATQAILTRHVPEDAQGRLQGAVSSLNSLTGIVGPGLYTTVFAAFVGEGARIVQPGAPFVVASGLVVLAFLAALRWAR